MEEKVKNPTKNPFAALGKWFYVLAAMALLLVASIVVIIVLAVGGKETPDPIDDVISEGTETGIYYYDTVLGEYTLSLNSGNRFTIAGPDLNKSGEYTVADGTVTLDFVRDEDGTATATLSADGISLNYDSKTMNFLKKITYTVTFSTDGGSAVDAISVINGKTVAKPGDPEKDGNVFLGWYSDVALTAAYAFGTPVKADTTVYAKWAAYTAGQDEYVVDFNLGYEAAAPANVSTVGGKLVFDAEYTEPTREGYTFVGWFVSAYEDGSKLTYLATEGTVLNANTTLFAVWAENTVEGLAAPNVSVVGNNISWNAVDGATAYQVTVSDSEGNVLLDKSVGATVETYDFALAAAGNYEVKVVAKGANNATSAPTFRYVANKALGRVSKFEVLDGKVLVYNAVEGAEKYFITVNCGNSEHNHTLLDNGKSTVYNFLNCSMQPEGITFVVTAKASGYADSVSETFTYVRNLDKVGTIAYDAENATFSWGSVANASKYIVTVKIGDKTVTVDNGSKTTFSVKNYSGEISVSVVPVSDGYNSSEATVATCTKTTPAAPVNVTVNNMTVKWDAVDGAKDYIVKINGTSYNAGSANEYDLRETGLAFLSGEKYTVTVRAVGETENSLESDALEVTYLTMGKVSYYANTVSWAPVAGATKYEVKVNDGASVIVSGKTETKIVLTKEGVNTVSVRTADFANAEWATVEVVAYKVVYDSRSSNGSVTEFVAKGDNLALPEDFEYVGFEFDAWYNTPGVASGNGAVVENIFNANGAITLYANWTPKKYSVQIVGVDSSTMNGAATDDVHEVTYTKGYKLPVMTTTDPVKSNFAGWYTGPGGTGIKLTDYLGNSVAPYGVADNSIAYPYFTSGMIFELKTDGTYAVRRGADIHIIPVITIPAYFDGVKVTTILENGFYNCDKLVEIRIPDTIELIGVDAFGGCDGLKSVEVYEVETATPHEVVYTSHDGVLIYNDVASSTSYIEFCPRAKTGSFEIPSNVTAIRNRAFYYSKLSSITVAKEVNYIGSYAFAYARSLTDIVFEEGGSSYVSFANTAFYGCSAVKTITLPAHMKGLGEDEAFDLTTLDYLTALESISVEKAADAGYSAVEGMLCNTLGDTLLYAPKAYTNSAGMVKIPAGIITIGENVFRNRTTFAEIVIPNYVCEIGANAFSGCTSVTKITVNGSRNRDLVIGENAFAGCENVTAVIFAGNNGTAVDAGKITIGASAFVGLEDLRTLTVEAGANIAVVGNGAFANNAKLRNISVADGAVITEIGAKAFAGCVSIGTYTIHATTKIIGDNAFEGCELISSVIFAPNGEDIAFGNKVFKDCVSLNTIELPATVQSFDGSVFDGCDSLSEVKVDAANEHLTSDKGILYSKDMSELMFYPKSNNDPDLSELPWDKITKIGNSVFRNNVTVTEISLPNTITYIGNDAFNGCVNLESFEIANGGSALAVGSYAFANCPKLETVTLPDATATIGDGAFYITSIADFTVPSGVTSIGKSAFAYTNITEITIPANVAVIGDGAFANSKLASITIVDGEGAAELSIGDINDTVGVFANTALTSVNIPKRVIALGANSFASTKALTTVTFAADSMLETLGASAFKGSALTTINLEATKATSIEASAFESSAITAITIPATVTEIKANAFASTASLAAVTFAPGGTDSLKVENNAFKSTVFTAITFPKRLADSSDYITAAAKINVKSFYMIFNGNTKLTEVNVEAGGTYYGSKDGVVYEKDSAGNLAELLYCPPAKTGDLVVPNTVTYVEHNAFNATKLTSVTFEDFASDHENYGKPILSIGSGVTATTNKTDVAVFGNTSSLKTVNLPSHLKFLGSGAFYKISTTGFAVNFSPATPAIEVAPVAIYSNSGLTSLALPKIANMNYPGLTSHNTFASNSKLTTVTFASGSTFTVVPYNAFYGCSALTSIDIPDSVTVIANLAFSGCSKLASVNFTENSQLVEFKNLAFQNCTSLTSFKFPPKASILGSKMFQGCSKITRIELSNNIESTVYADSTTGAPCSLFEGCTSLSEIVIPTNHPTLVSVDGVIYDLTQTMLYAFPPKLPITDGKYTVPATVKQIGPYAFFGFAGTAIELPAGLTTISDFAFSTAKIKTITIPASVTTIGASAFAGTPYMAPMALTTVVVEPKSQLTSIGQNAFLAASNLTSINLPDNIETIGGSAFAYCSKLTEIILPAALKEIPNTLFQYDSGILSITIQSRITRIGNNAFFGTKITEMHLPSSLVSIGDTIFSSCSKLEVVTFEEGSVITDIPKQTFSGCSALKEIVLPESVTTIGAQAFNNCKALERVDLSKTKITSFSSETGTKVNGVPQYTGIVEGNANLKEFLLPETMEYIDIETFKGCKSLESITIPQNVTYIGDLAFDGCTGLKTVQFARDALITELGSDPEVYCSIFRNTTSLESVTLPESITTIGAGVFENSGIASVVLPSKLESISEAAFKGCANLVEVDIPSTIEAVYASAFMDCTSLERATLEEGVELLGQDAFGNCVKLTYIKVPATVMHMGGNPFSNCVGITELDIAPENENFIKGTDGVLYDSNVRTVIFYPAYLEAENYAVPATVYEFAASAFMGSQLKSIVIPDTVKEIPDGCFGGSAKLETVTIPLSISRIGNAAFRNCVSLKSAVVPSTCTEIGASAFENCSSMQSFDFGKRNTALTIGEYMLSGTTALKSITAPEGVTVIPAYCFAGTGLESFTVPETIVDISAEGIFMGAASLKTVVFEGNVDYANNWLGMYAFKDCTSLQSITVPEGIDNLGKGYSYESSTFANCTSLKSVTLLSPDLKGIGYRAFENCTALETVTFNDALYTSASKLVGLGKSAFRNCSSLVNFKFPYNVAYYSSAYQAFENCSSLTGVITLTGSKVQMGGGFLKNCTSITELHLSCLNYVYNTTYDEAGTAIFGAFSGNFAGWTEEQSIYFDNLSYTDLVSGSSYKKYFTPVSGATASNALLINCEAKVYDKDGNQVIYDSETGYITEVLDSNGEVIYTYGA